MEQRSAEVSRPLLDQCPSQHPELAAACFGLLAARRLARQGTMGEDPTAFAADPVTGLRPRAGAAPQALIARSPGSGWGLGSAARGQVRGLLELYLPLLPGCPEEPLTLGHLGQSLDGYIATDRGESCFITGPENMLVCAEGLAVSGRRGQAGVLAVPAHAGRLRGCEQLDSATTTVTGSRPIRS